MELVVHICNPERNQQLVYTVAIKVDFVFVEEPGFTTSINVEQISLIDVTRMGMVVNIVKILPFIAGIFS